MRSVIKHTPTILLVLAVGLFLAINGLMQANPQQRTVEPPMAQQHNVWVEQQLERMETIKVGMTRADLLKVFTTEGGLSTGLRRTYVYRECPYFKVDVGFEPVGRSARDKGGRVTLT